MILEYQISINLFGPAISLIILCLTCFHTPLKQKPEKNRSHSSSQTPIPPFSPSSHLSLSLKPDKRYLHQLPPHIRLEHHHHHTLFSCCRHGGPASTDEQICRTGVRNTVHNLWEILYTHGTEPVLRPCATPVAKSSPLLLQHKNYKTGSIKQAGGVLSLSI